VDLCDGCISEAEKASYYAVKPDPVHHQVRCDGCSATDLRGTLWTTDDPWTRASVADYAENSLDYCDSCYRGLSEDEQAKLTPVLKPEYPDPVLRAP